MRKQLSVAISRLFPRVNAKKFPRSCADSGSQGIFSSGWWRQSQRTAIAGCR